MIPHRRRQAEWRENGCGLRESGRDGGPARPAVAAGASFPHKDQLSGSNVSLRLVEPKVIQESDHIRHLGPPETRERDTTSPHGAIHLEGMVPQLPRDLRNLKTQGRSAKVGPGASAASVGSVAGGTALGCKKPPSVVGVRWLQKNGPPLAEPRFLSDVGVDICQLSPDKDGQGNTERRLARAHDRTTVPHALGKHYRRDVASVVVKGR